MNHAKPRPIVAVIDDEDIIADTLSEILKMYGYQARAYHSGEAALADAEEFGPNVILSDIRMPKMDGIETAKRFRLLHPDCKVVLFTATPLSGEVYEKIIRLGVRIPAASSSSAGCGGPAAGRRFGVPGADDGRDSGDTDGMQILGARRGSRNRQTDVKYRAIF